MLPAIKHITVEIFIFKKTAHHCIVHSTQPSCCSKKKHCANQYSAELNHTDCYWQKSCKVDILHLSENMVYLYFSRWCRNTI